MPCWPYSSANLPASKSNKNPTLLATSRRVFRSSLTLEVILKWESDKLFRQLLRLKLKANKETRPKTISKSQARHPLMFMAPMATTIKIITHTTISHALRLTFTSQDQAPSASRATGSRPTGLARSSTTVASTPTPSRRVAVIPKFSIWALTM